MEQEKNNGEPASMPPATAYLKEARAHLRSGQLKKAYSVLLKAGSAYPGHPIILSYCGWLQALVDKKHLSGVTSCRKALLNFRTSDPDTAQAVYPFLHLNLGRTLLIAGRKKEAVESFRKGLNYDRGHSELKKEMKALGIRKNPVLPFLSRSNLFNKYAGKLLHGKSTAVRFCY